MKHLIKIETTEHGVLSVHHFGDDQQWCEAGQSVKVSNQPDNGWGLQKIYYIVDGSTEKHAIDITTQTFVMPSGNVTIGGVFKRFVTGDWTEGKNPTVGSPLVLDADGSPTPVDVDDFGETILGTEPVSEALAAKLTTPEGGEAGQVIQLDAEGNPEWTTPLAGSVPDVAMDDDSTNAVQNKVIKKYVDDLADEVHNDYAKQDGYYDLLHAGEAKNIEGTEPVEAVFTDRTAGGTVDIATGLASIDGIKGNSMAWNQLVKNPAMLSVSNWVGNINVTGEYVDNVLIAKPTLSSTNIVVKQQNTIIANHKYYVFAVLKLNAANYPSNNRFGYFIGNTTTWFIGVSYTGQIQRLATVVSVTENKTEIAFGPYGAANSFSTEDSFELHFAGCIDLTLLGYPNIDTQTPTVAEVEDWLSKNVGLRDYYPYNAGQLIDCKVQGIKTVGRNLFDVTTGKANLVAATDGNLTEGTDCYQIFGTFTSIADADGNAITPNASGYFNIAKPTEITVTGGDATTCVMLTWSGTHNSEFVAHWTETKPFDVTKIYGKLNGEGELVQVFAGGMRKADYDGNIRDVLYVENGVTKAKVNVAKQSVTGAIGDTVTLVGCDTTAMDFISAQEIGTLSGGVLTLTAAADAVDVNYPLATPAVYTDLVYRDNGEDTPFSLPINYKVDDWGTEQQVLPAPVSDEVTSCAAKLSLIYGVNAADFIKNAPKNFVSIDRTSGTNGSFDQFLSALGTAMGGTWSKEWSDENNRWEFSFEADPEPTPDPQEP